MAGLFSALTRDSGNWQERLEAAADAWVDHMFHLRPIEISKLQRIALAQERVLARQAAPLTVWPQK
jgi:hypothetical protein